jgi:uncharacterized protein YbjT (DUF2867 family)
MIIVAGATGKLGSQIVSQLLERVSAEEIGVSVRDPAAAGDLAARGLRVRRGDYADSSSLASAFEDATQVMIVSSGVSGQAAVSLHAAAIAAARAAGAKRIVYTSHQGAGSQSLFGPMTVHAATEAVLAEDGAPFTVLRNGFYASSIPFLLGPALQTGELIAPADGPVSWTTHADLAEAAAIILAAEGSLDGPTPPLTAPEALDLSAIAELLTELTGRSIRRVVADDDVWLAGLIAGGLPAERANLLLGMFHASRRGEFAVTDPALEGLLGRPATSVRSVLKTLVAAG